MKTFYIYSMLFAVIFVVGCNTTKRSSRTTTAAATNPVVNRTLNQHDDQIAKLTFKFNQLKESNRSCVEYINKLNKQVALLNRKTVLLEQANKQLTLQMENEKIARRKEIDTLLKEVAKETAAAINSRRTPPPSKPHRTTPTRTSGPAMAGEFYEYTVEQGATLSVIAKAYKVSIANIKKANRLKNDRIYIGQKLYIPKK